ncbi:protoporphyrinogen oxidase HemJ [Rhodobacteraceae bacterium CCMM004]|nr:protoporphyrinogen oxidase HemJ [Rhodobacteraceae bacterium CCMM004]
MIDLLSVLYPWIKSVHVMAVIAWMAGLFYLPRLFVYHAESGGENVEMIATFRTMERKLHKVIMNPAMMTTWVLGLILAATPGVVDWGAVWPWIKAVGVIAMTVFHVWCSRQRRVMETAPPPLSGRRYRAMNEVPTLLMVAIVVAVIVRPF